jgi:hypothetical protein
VSPSADDPGVAIELAVADTANCRRPCEAAKSTADHGPTCAHRIGKEPDLPVQNTAIRSSHAAGPCQFADVHARNHPETKGLLIN